jgi:hypothetical protein
MCGEELGRPRVAAIDRVAEHRVEVAVRLVVVQREDEPGAFHATRLILHLHSSWWDNRTSPGPSLVWRASVWRAKMFGARGLEASVCEKNYAPFFDKAVATIGMACDDFKPN